MQKKQIISQYKWQVIIWFTLLQMIIVWLNSCTPQAEPTYLSPTREVALTIVPTVEIPPITIVPATITVIPPTSTPPPVIPLEVETIDISNEFFTGTQYHFLEPLEVVGMLPESGKLLMIYDYNQLWAVDINSLTAHVLADEKIRWPVFVPSQANQIVFTRFESGRDYSVWVANRDGSNPLLLGTTWGDSPLVSATDDGKVLILENGHLVLKWREGEGIQSQQLSSLESKLNLTWEKLEPNADGFDSPIDFMLSPNGEWVGVFDGEQNKFWIATIDGQLIHEVPINPSFLELENNLDTVLLQVTFTGWSPDSQTLAYTEGYANYATPHDSQHEIKWITIADGQPVNITDASTTYGSGLNWSPDGQFILFSYESYGEMLEKPGTGLFFADIDRRDIKQVSENYFGYFPFWSSNGHTLIYGCWGADPDSDSVVVDTCIVSENK